MKLQQVRTLLQGRVSMQAVLVVPFLLQVFGIVGLVTYLCYRSGQEALEKMAFDLTAAAAERTSDRLQSHFNTIHKLLVLNQHDIQQGHIQASDLDTLGQHFWHQLQVFDATTTLSFTRPNGAYVGVGYDHSGSSVSGETMVLSRVEERDPKTRKDYRLHPQDRVPQWLQTIPNWDPRQQPGYELALQNPIQQWTELHASTHAPTTALDATLPVYREGNLEGVLTARVLLPDLNRLIYQISAAETWQIIILDRSGRLLASSTGESLLVRHPGMDVWNPKRMTESTDPLTQSIAQLLQTQWPDLSQIQQAERLYMWDGPGETGNTMFPVPRGLRSPRYFVEIRPYGDGYGLDWLVIAVIPRAQFAPEIYENLRQTAIWSLLALGGAIALSTYTTRWITGPILGLRDAANQIAQGNYTIPMASTPIRELRQLAFAFRQMADQLQLSTDEMRALNADLLHSRSQMELFLEAVPLGIVIYAADSTVAYRNQAAQRLLGNPLGSTSPELLTQRFYRVGTQEPYPPEQHPAIAALRGEYTIINDLELARGEIRVALEMRATPIFSEEGSITHALVVFQDITARREAEQVLADYNRHLEQQVQQRTQTLEQEILERQQVAQALRQSEATQRAILRAIPDLLLRVRGDGTYLARLNGSEVAILSGNQDISGKTVHQIMPPDLAEKRMHVIRRALRTGDMQIYEQQVELNGAMRDEETRIVKTGDDEVLVIVRDISDRKQAERALQNSENRNRAILMAIPDLMFHVNREGVYLGYLRSQSLMDVLPPDLDPTGKLMQDCMPTDFAQRQLRYLHLALETQTLQVYEQSIQIQGQMQWEEVRVMPCGPDEVLFLIRDISDRKRYEAELKQANDRLEYLAQTDGLTQLANRRHFDH